MVMVAMMMLTVVMVMMKVEVNDDHHVDCGDENRCDDGDSACSQPALHATQP